MAKRPTKKLLVEGKEDQFAIVGLMSAHVEWGNTPEEWPVQIKDQDGITNLLADGVIPTYLKSSEAETLGIVVDANDQFEGRWQRLRDLCRDAFPDVPADLPEDGLVLQNAEGRRLGVWIMPDNRSRGILETFLTFLVPAEGKALWQYAQRAAAEARKRGAPFNENHTDKARIHTWLAWQDPPGAPFGIALKRKCLDPNSPHAAPFVAWFKELYQL